MLLAACSIMPSTILGRELRPAPPDTTTNIGGPTGVLIGGEVEPLVPVTLADGAVGSELATWLSVPERQALAAASQRAAVAESTSQIAWSAKAPNGDTTAVGFVMPVSNAYRSTRGQICRDLVQSLERDDTALRQPVSLCRTDQGAGLWVWLIPTWP